MTEALFREIGQAENSILEREKGVLCLYAALKKAGAFQSEADEKVRTVAHVYHPPILTQPALL